MGSVSWGRVVLPHVSTVVDAWWHALGSGRFFTWWSALVSFIIMGLLVVPDYGGTTLLSYADAAIVSVLGWVLLAIPFLGVAGLERRLHSHGARAAIVLAALVAVSAARPLVNQSLSMWLFDETTIGAWPVRFATNLGIALVGFSFVAVATTQYYEDRQTTQWLAIALARMDATRHRAALYEAGARRAIEHTVGGLRAQRDVLLRGELTFEAVRAYAELVRAASHQLGDMATTSLATEPSTQPVVAASIAPAHKPLLERLSPTPVFCVGLIYVVMCAPFGFAAGGTVLVLAMFAVMLPLDALVGVILRASMRRITGATGGLIFIGVWTLAGMAAVVAGDVLIPGLGILGLVPSLALPAAAIIISATIDAHRSASRAEARATATLARNALALAERARTVRSPLEAAIGVLHGGVQGRCVIFAARVDEPGATPADIARFRTETDAAFDEIIGLRPVPAPGDLEGLLAVWRDVVDVASHFASEVRPMLDDAVTQHHVCDIVNEGLVNAVKHGGARHVQVGLDTTSDGNLRVRVTSPGVLAHAASVGGRGIAALPGAAHLSQRGANVVLEVVLPTADSVKSATSVGLADPLQSGHFVAR